MNKYCNHERIEFKYPMWFKFKGNGDIVRFDSLGTGTLIKKEGNHNFEAGHFFTGLVAHTFEEWEQVENPELTKFKVTNE